MNDLQNIEAEIGRIMGKLYADACNAVHQSDFIEAAQALDQLCSSRELAGMEWVGDTPTTPKLHGRFQLTDGQVKGIEAWIKEMQEWNNPHWVKTVEKRDGYAMALRHLHYALITEDVQLSAGAGATSAHSNSALKKKEK